MSLTVTLQSKMEERDMSPKIRPTRAEAEEAVRTIISYIGDDPDRKSLRETPKRVIASYDEFFCGYSKEPSTAELRIFDLPEGFNNTIQLNNIRLESYCEHHMAPIIGEVHIAYQPAECILGLSKIARIVDIHAKRLQIQERLVFEIAQTIEEIASPRGVAVVIDAEHHCLSTRGVHKPGAQMRTVHYSGSFEDYEKRKEFLDSISRS